MAFQVTPDTDIAEAAMFHGVYAKLNDGGSGTFAVAAGTNNPIDFDEVRYDTDGFWDASNPERLTIPEGVNFVRTWGSATFADGTILSGPLQLVLRRMSSAGAALDAYASSQTLGNRGHISAPPIYVEPGDYIVLLCKHAEAGSITAISQRTFLALEAVKTPFGRPDSPTLP